MNFVEFVYPKILNVLVFQISFQISFQEMKYDALFIYISICIKYALYLDRFREVICKNCNFELNKTDYKYFFRRILSEMK